MSGIVISPAESVSLKCECGCSTVVFEKFDWDNDGKDVDYTISFQDDYLHNNTNGLIGRIKKAFRILTGRPIYYAEVDANKESMMEFLKSALKIMEESNES